MFISLAQRTMADKEMRALFKLKGILYESEMNQVTSLNLFDQLVKPRVLSGSELWGADLLNISSLQNFLESMEKPTWAHLDTDIVAIRGELGRAPLAIDITAMRGELGRAPLDTDIAANVMK